MCRSCAPLLSSWCNLSWRQKGESKQKTKKAKHAKNYCLNELSFYKNYHQKGFTWVFQDVFQLIAMIRRSLHWICLELSLLKKILEFRLFHFFAVKYLNLGQFKFIGFRKVNLLMISSSVNKLHYAYFSFPKNAILCKVWYINTLAEVCTLKTFVSQIREQMSDPDSNF